MKHSICPVPATVCPGIRLKDLWLEPKCGFDVFWR
jgi:hypothetical protein